jgi:hypothetical protein
MAYWDPTVKLTVPEDEFRVAAVGLVRSCALVCREDRCRPTHWQCRRSDIDRLNADVCARSIHPI